MDKCIVMLSSYNGENYIKEQIDSILQQQGVDVQLYIRDDGSKDNTIEIVEKLMMVNSRIHLLKEENVGVTASFKRLAEYIYMRDFDCQFYAFADQDDVWISDKLQIAIELLKKKQQQEPVLYYSNLKVVTNDLEYIFDRFDTAYVHNSKESMLAEINVLGCTCVFNKSLLAEFAQSVFDMKIPHDAWIALQAMFLGECIYDSSAHILYRQHGNNESGQVVKGYQKLQSYLHKISQVKNMKRDYELFAVEFFKNYGDIINASDKIKFLMLAEYRKSIKYRLKLLFTFSINSHHFLKEVSRRIRVIYGNL